MQIFRCPACSSPVYFHNLACGCGQEVSFDPDTQSMIAGAAHCANRDDIACNWVAEQGGLCRSCAMTETVPDLRAEQNLPLWEESESAKRRMLAELSRWGWFTPVDSGARPVFRMLSEETLHGGADVIMGHADGIITINVTEASDAVLAHRQAQFGELYRTMLGHMRHEMAHFLFLRLAEDPAFLDDFRALFGDERADYGAALQRHYDAPMEPGAQYITTYATAHPHEDWAETLAHLQHLVSMLDSGVASGLRLPESPADGYDPYLEADTEVLITRAVHLSIAVNHVNRALDLPDLYPFVLTQPVREKMALAHRWLRRL
ncbi:putative zinc-binding metallopeptidase [Alloyangia pacifica]|uniref:zinc-binding metallopeptidase family protein n=1 Tax=Alloyangia pacifica TaxID=311180 RepID=UPI001CFCE1E1|nr:putative zinc-binding metallopeptidase [Alloyangia pacifica]